MFGEMGGSKNEPAELRLVRKTARVWHEFPLSAGGRERGHTRGLSDWRRIGPTGKNQSVNRAAGRENPQNSLSLLPSIN